MRRVILLLALVGCGLPEADELYGLWVNVDGGEVRAWQFADTLDVSGLDGQSDVFELYYYPEGTDAVAVQRGTFEVKVAPLTEADQQEQDALVQHVLWSTSSEQIGQTFGNQLFRHSGSKLVLGSQSAASGKRTFESVEALP